MGQKLETIAPLANILNIFNITLRRWRPFSAYEKSCSSRKTHVRTNEVLASGCAQHTKSNRVNCVRNYIKYSCSITPIKWIITWMFLFLLLLLLLLLRVMNCVMWKALFVAVCAHTSIPVQSSIISLLKFIQIKMLLRFFLLHHRPQPNPNGPRTFEHNNKNNNSNHVAPCPAALRRCS